MTPNDRSQLSIDIEKMRQSTLGHDRRTFIGGINAMHEQIVNNCALSKEEQFTLTGLHQELVQKVLGETDTRSDTSRPSYVLPFRRTQAWVIAFIAIGIMTLWGISAMMGHVAMQQQIAAAVPYPIDAE